MKVICPIGRPFGRADKFPLADSNRILAVPGRVDIPVRTRYAATMVSALGTMACSGIGHSSAPGANIHLKEAYGATARRQPE